MGKKFEEESSKNIHVWFDSLPTISKIEAYNHENSFGFVIPFTITGFGFGEITLGVDKKTGEAYVDLESMSPERCGEIVERTIGRVVEDALDNWKKIEQEIEKNNEDTNID